MPEDTPTDTLSFDTIFVGQSDPTHPERIADTVVAHQVANDLVAEAKNLRVNPISHLKKKSDDILPIAQAARYVALEQRANTNPVTGLLNERFLRASLPIELARSKRGEFVALLSADMQTLKWFNDNGGHATGDRALSRVGRVLSEAVRESDFPIHLHGDEFAAILPHAGQAGLETSSKKTSLKEDIAIIALRVNERVNEQVIEISNGAKKRNIHLDIGVTVASEHDTYETTTKRADNASYLIKEYNKIYENEGIHRIVVATILSNGDDVYEFVYYDSQGIIVFESIPDANDRIKNKPK